MLEAHPAAELFPLMSEEEFATFKQDVAVRGLIEAIWLYDGKILDGRNRYRACCELSIEPKFRDYAGDSPVAFVWSLNGTRRQLSKSQLAVIAVKMLAPLKEEAKKRLATSTGGSRPTPVPVEAEKGEAVLQAAKLVGVGKTQVQDAKAVVEHAPDLVPEIEAGRMSVDKARTILRNRPLPDGAKQPREKRAADIRLLAADGNRASQIADQLGIGEERVRLIARQEDITLPDAAIGRPHKIDAARVIENTIHGLEGFALGLQTINGAVKQIDSATAAQWSESLKSSLLPIHKLQKQLREVANGN